MVRSMTDYEHESRYFDIDPGPDARFLDRVADGMNEQAALAVYRTLVAVVSAFLIGVHALALGWLLSEIEVDHRHETVLMLVVLIVFAYNVGLSIQRVMGAWSIRVLDE
jgi:hypothetical protein